MNSKMSELDSKISDVNYWSFLPKNIYSNLTARMRRQATRIYSNLTARMRQATRGGDKKLVDLRTASREGVLVYRLTGIQVS